MAKSRINRRAFIAQAAGTTAGLTEFSRALPAKADAPAAPDNPAKEPQLPAIHLDELYQTVQTVIAGKRIGTPVFVRYTVQGQEDEKAIVDMLARMTETVQAWIGQALERIYATGSVSSGQVCLSLQFQGGATGLVSYARVKVKGGGVDLMVIGNHGAIYHETPQAHGSQPAGFDPSEKKAEPKCREVIERALRSGKPVPVSSGERP